MRFIDLTHTYTPQMRGVSWESACVLEKDGWNATTLHLYSHAGTHMDAPIHFGVNALTIDQLPLQNCIGPAWVLRLPALRDSELITVEHLGSVADQISTGDSLLIQTGWSGRIGGVAYYENFPRISEELAHWLVAKQVRMLGIEQPSVADVTDLAEVTHIHRILLAGNVTILEGLCNLAQIQVENVWLIALPIKFEGGDGSPARVMAIENGALIETAPSDAN